MGESAALDGERVLSRVGDWRAIRGEDTPELFGVLGGIAGFAGYFAGLYAGEVATAAALAGAVMLGRAARSPFSPLRVRRGLCLRGVIEPNARAFIAIGERDPVVYVRTVSHQPANDNKALVGVFRETVRGVPFQIRLVDGRLARLEPAAVALVAPLVPLRSLSHDDRVALGAPTRGRWGWWVQQASLRVGVEVEMIARACPIVDPAGQAAPGRGIPMRTELVSPSGAQIRLRPLG